MHPSEKTDPNFINAPPPVRSGTTKPTVKPVTVPIEEVDKSHNVSEDTSVDDEFQDAREVESDDEDDTIGSNNEPLGYQPVSKMVFAHSDDKSCTINSDRLYHY